LSLKSASRVVARRYARALLDVVASGPQGVAGAPEAVRNALDGARALLEHNPELLRALTHPTIPVAARQRVADAVWGQAPEPVKRLLRLLVERDRVQILPAIAQAYAQAWNESRGVVSAAAVSAVELDAAQKEALGRALGQAAGGKVVELETRVEPAVLGGLRVTMGGRTLDGTVAAQLRALRRRLQGAA
jgi:F-type H+-transporting ATPase subunit delta